MRRQNSARHEPCRPFRRRCRVTCPDGCGARRNRRRRHRYAFPTKRPALAGRCVRPVPAPRRRTHAGTRRRRCRGRCHDHLRAAQDRALSCGDGRTRRRHPRHHAGSRQCQGDDHRETRLYRPRRGHCRAGGRHRAPAVLTTAPRGLGLPLWHPALVLGTWFGAALLPVMPGTWGSLAALPGAWVIRSLWGVAGLAIAAAIVFAVGCWAAGTMAKTSGLRDPGAIVIEEVAAQWLVLLPAPPAPLPYPPPFLLFPIFPPSNPWPVACAHSPLPSWAH